MIQLSIIIPAYNEALRIAPTLLQFHQYLSTSGYSFELIVVDDGSTDNTVAIVAAMAAEMPQLSLLPLPYNKGKGNAVRHGMLAGQGAIRIFSDADGSTPIAELDKLLAQLNTGNTSIAIGSRYLKQSEVTVQQPRLRIFWSRMVNRIMQKSLLPGILDPHCGFKAFTAAATNFLFPRCRINGWSFDVEVLALALANNYTIAEVPVKWANDNRSKGRISQMPREIYNILKIRKRIHAERNGRY